MAVFSLNCIGSVYAMTNECENSVVYYMRDTTGALFSPTVYKTGGKGANKKTINPLESQGSIILTPNHNFLFVVNVGDNTISSFIVLEYGLKLIDVVSSNGISPISLTYINNCLYVLNSGDKKNRPNISAFKLENDGRLSYIHNSTAILKAPPSSPACIVSNFQDNNLIVTYPKYNNISIFNINKNGTLSKSYKNNSVHGKPVGAAYISNSILLTTNFDSSSLSSYKVCNDNSLRVISESIKNNQLESCWVSIYPNEEYAYTSNPNSGTVSFYRIAKNGSLTVVESVPTTPNMKGYPIDNAIDQLGQNLYVLNGLNGTITVFTIKSGGQLGLLQIYQDTKLPKFKSQGLAAF